MKKVLSLFLAVVMLCSLIMLLPVSSNAISTSGWCGDNVSFTFNKSTGALTISGSGEMYDYDGSDSPFYDWSYVDKIKSVVIKYGVSSIGNYSFYSCTELKNVSIPNSVTSIGEYAFCGSSDLTSITIPNSIKSISSYAFYGCRGLTSVTIPDSVTSIGGSAFEGCSGLKNITISDSVKSIGDGAFNGCSGLTSIAIPDSVTSIGDSAFRGCSGLTGITIPNSVTSIGNSAFQRCSSLKSITIPNSVTSIGDVAFWGCSGLTSVNISSIASWCKICFSSETSNPLYYANNLYLNGKLVTDLVIPNSITSIGSSAFSGCTGLTSITIPDSVKSIGSYAFFDCSGLTSITIPDSVKSIGDNAFSGCSGLKSVTIPASVRSIGSYAFYCCSNLTSIIIPNSVTSIGEYAFEDCGMIIYEGSATGYPWGGSIGIRDGNFIYADNQKSRLVKYIANTTNVTIPTSVTSIEDNAFNDCTKLTNLTISRHVVSISAQAFKNCPNLAVFTVDSKNSLFKTDKNKSCLLSGPTLVLGGKNTTIPNSVEYIGEYAFCGRKGIKTITIPDDTVIHSYAFYDCKDLTSVIYNYNIYDYKDYIVAVVDDYAFSNCPNLQTFSFKGYSVEQRTDEKGVYVGSHAFENCKKLNIVNFDALQIYSIEDYAFHNCSSLKSVKLNTKDFSWDPYENDWKLIGDYAFSNCTGLTDFSTTNGVSGELGNHAFDGCTSLSVVTIPNIVTIEDYAFNNCKSLKDISLTSCYKLGKNAFNNCSSLTNVAFCVPYITVDENVFAGCTAIKYIFYNSDEYDLNRAKINQDVLKQIKALNIHYDMKWHNYKVLKTVKPTYISLGTTLFECTVCGARFKAFKAPTGKLTLKHSARTANAIKVQWNNVNTATGYQVQISTKDGKKWSTYATLKAGVTNYTFKSLAAGNNYKFRVRFYINASDGKNYFSPWSATLNSPTLPGGTTLTKLTPAKKAFTAQWKKQAVSGYQVQYSLKANFAGAKTITVKNPKSLKATASKLYAGKYYFVRIRTYKTITKANYFSAWSKTYKVKTK